MTIEQYPNRRTVLKIAGSIGILSTAGCLDQADDYTGEQESETGTNDHDDDHDRDSNVDEPVASAEVAMITDDGHHFDPHLVWVENGGTVTWTNESGSHTTTAYHPAHDKPQRIPDDAEPWDSGMHSEEGTTFERSFEVDGVYDYYCAPHEFRAMVGTVIVGDPDPHEQPGLESPQDEVPAEARDLLEELNAAANEAIGHTH